MRQEQPRLDPSDRVIDESCEILSLLVGDRGAEILDFNQTLSDEHYLSDFVHPGHPRVADHELEQSLRQGIDLLNERLNLSVLFGAAKVDLFGDRETWQVLRRETEDDKSLAPYTVGDFSIEGRKQGKLVVTTHHSSKGRQCAAVVIPELVQEVFPAAP